MKKLMIAAAVACATVAGFAIESQVVGYQNKALVNNAYNSCVSTFAGVDGGKNRTLGDIAATMGSWGSVLQLVHTDGSTPMINVGGDDYEAVFYYLNEGDGAEGAGWYLRDNDLNCMNSYALPYGTGFLVDCQGDDECLTFAGSVLRGPQGIDLTENVYNMTGNATPKDWTLGDIAATMGSWGSVLQLVHTDGSTPMINVGGDEYEAVFYYLNEGDGAEGAGWYLRDNDLNCMNAMDVPAGMGFLIDCQGADEQIVMPEVLAE